MRMLLVTRRTVPLDRLDEYAQAWQQLTAAAHESGGRAWLFRRSGHDDQMVEFMEWQAETPLTRPEELDLARQALDAVAPGVSDVLEEAQFE